MLSLDVGKDSPRPRSSSRLHATSVNGRNGDQLSDESTSPICFRL